MILKLLKNPPPPSQSDNSSALRIIHAGGHVEAYYMAVPARRILDSYPASVLARPDVFRRPWDAVVSPEEILRPGQKFFLVPRRSLRKLRRRIPWRLPEVAGGDGSGSVRFVEAGTDGDLKKRVTWQPVLTSIVEIDA